MKNRITEEHIQIIKDFNKTKKSIYNMGLDKWRERMLAGGTMMQSGTSNYVYKINKDEIRVDRLYYGSLNLDEPITNRNVHNFMDGPKNEHMFYEIDEAGEPMIYKPKTIEEIIGEI